MLTKRIIPCLDCKDGRVVKGIKFQNLRDSGDPAELAHLYEEQGADEIVILDVAATPNERANQIETIHSVRKLLHIPLTVGGGVREVNDAKRLLDAGADKVSVNTAAVNNPEMLTQMANAFGRQCTVLAIDAIRAATGWQVVVRSGSTNTGKDVIVWAKEAQDLGAGEILLTSFDRDGTREGYDLELLSAVSSAVNIPVIASGGANSPEHLLAAFNAGADAVLAASIFHEGDYTVKELKSFLNKAGVAIRYDYSID